MILEKININTFGENCYIVASDSTKEAAIIDPGAEFNKIDDKIKKLGLLPRLIILTHGHGDHIGAVGELVEKYKMKVYAHEDELDLLSNSTMNFSKMMFGIDKSFTPDILLKDKDVVTLNDLVFEIIHTPGHTRGGICIKVGDVMFTGDTLFDKSIGRTDFPNGSYDELIDSITNKIFTYDDNIVIYPGHNMSSTIGSEKKLNPFVN